MLHTVQWMMIQPSANYGKKALKKTKWMIHRVSATTVITWHYKSTVHSTKKTMCQKNSMLSFDTLKRILCITAFLTHSINWKVQNAKLWQWQWQNTNYKERKMWKNFAFDSYFLFCIYTMVILAVTAMQILIFRILHFTFDPLITLCC